MAVQHVTDSSSRVLKPLIESIMLRMPSITDPHHTKITDHEAEVSSHRSPVMHVTHSTFDHLHERCIPVFHPYKLQQSGSVWQFVSPTWRLRTLLPWTISFIDRRPRKMCDSGKSKGAFERIFDPRFRPWVCGA
jgi:hypothetical protein